MVSIIRPMVRAMVSRRVTAVASPSSSVSAQDTDSNVDGAAIDTDGTQGDFKPAIRSSGHSFSRGSKWIVQRQHEEFDGKEWKVVRIVENGAEVFRG